MRKKYLLLLVVVAFVLSIVIVLPKSDLLSRDRTKEAYDHNPTGEKRAKPQREAFDLQREKANFTDPLPHAKNAPDENKEDPTKGLSQLQKQDPQMQERIARLEAKKQEQELERQVDKQKQTHIAELQAQKKAHVEENRKAREENKSAKVEVDIYEPNNTAATATNVGPLPAYANNLDIDPLGDHDWGKFTLPAGAWVHIATDEEPGMPTPVGDTVIRLVDTDGVTELALDDDSGPGFYSDLVYGPVAGGQYYVEIWGFIDAVTGQYAITIEEIPPPCVADAYEPDNTPAQATPIAIGDVVPMGEHNICPGFESDFFSFDAAAGTCVDIAVNTGNPAGTDLDPYVILYDVDGVTVIDADDDGGPNWDSFLSAVLWNAGTYYIEVTTHWGWPLGIGDYELALTPSPMCVDAYEPDGDPVGDPCADPPIMTIGETLDRNIWPAWERDNAFFYANAGDQIMVECTTDDPWDGFNLELGIFMFDPGQGCPAGWWIADDWYGMGVGWDPHICIELPLTGWYGIAVTPSFWSLEGAGDYSITLDWADVDGFEPDDWWTEANGPVEYGECVNKHTICPVYDYFMDWNFGWPYYGMADEDYFGFNAEAGDVIAGVVNTPDPWDDLDPALELGEPIDPWWMWVLDFDDDGGPGYDSQINYVIGADGDYYFDVYGSWFYPLNFFTHTVGKYDFCLYKSPVCDFDSDKNVGLPPLAVNFWDNVLYGVTEWNWNLADNFGGWGSSKQRGIWRPQPTPFYEYWFTGKHDVLLKAGNPAGWCGDYKWECDCSFIEVYGPGGFTEMKVTQRDDEWPSEPWENAIDGDTWGWDGVATIGEWTPHDPSPVQPWANFEFVDGRTKMIEKVRIMVDAGVGHRDRWVTSFRVATSTDGVYWPLRLQVEDYLWGTDKPGCEWAEFYIPNGPVPAKYVKLIIDKPDAKSMALVQIAEFEVWEVLQVPDPANCSIVAEQPVCFIGGDNSTTITLTLKDANGDPVTGYNDFDIKKGAWGEHSSKFTFGPVTEVSPGVYEFEITAKREGVAKVVVGAHGAVVGYDKDKGWSCPVAFLGNHHEFTMTLLEHSDGHPNEGWENAIDGDLVGFDGTATVKGDPCYAVFDLGLDCMVNKFYVQTDNGTEDDAAKIVKRQAKRVLVETSLDGAVWEKAVEARIVAPDGQWLRSKSLMMARYVKLTILRPTEKQIPGGWRQIVEFEVHTDADKSKLLKKSPDVVELPTAFALGQNYPNPFNPSTKIDFELPENAHVTLKVYNTLGQEVASLVDEYRAAGYHTVEWNALDVPSGLYIYRIEAGNFVKSARMLLMK